MKKLLNILEIILILVVSCLMIFFYLKYSKYAKYVKQYSTDYQQLERVFNVQKKFLGNRFQLSDVEVKPYRKNNNLVLDKQQTQYFLIIFIGKVNCDLCLEEFSEISEKINKSMIYPIGVMYTSNDFDLEKTIKVSGIEYPMFYTHSSDWFTQNDLLIGPNAFLIDAKSNKVLYVYSNYERKTIDTKQIFFEFLKRLQD